MKGVFMSDKPKVYGEGQVKPENRETFSAPTPKFRPKPQDS